MTHDIDPPNPTNPPSTDTKPQDLAPADAPPEDIFNLGHLENIVRTMQGHVLPALTEQITSGDCSLEKLEGLFVLLHDHLADLGTQHYIREKRAAELEHIVFALEEQMEYAPPPDAVDMEEMLSMNAAVLNAGFHYYITNAARSRRGDQKILMALNMQSQLTRTIDAWRRLEQFQNERTK